MDNPYLNELRMKIERLIPKGEITLEMKERIITNLLLTDTKLSRIDLENLFNKIMLDS